MHGRPSVRSPWRLNNLTNGPGRCTTQRHDDRNEEARILWSQMFSHALRLHRYDEAYLALISNPDAERRQDGLSHFVTVVCENGQERLLSELPFAGLQTELESTLAFKARNALVTADMRPNYYKVGRGGAGGGWAGRGGAG